MNTPTAALIDIGNVLFTFDFESSLMRLVPDDATDGLQRIQSLLERKDDFESGKIDTEDYISWACAQLGFTGSHQRFREAWNSIFMPNPPMWDTLRAARERGLRLILFSNTNSLHADWLVDTQPGMELFDEAVLSYLVGGIKPHDKIYRHAIDTYQLDPARTLYVDDLPDNIANGRAHGFRCHLYDHRQHDAFETWFTEEFPPS